MNKETFEKLEQAIVYCAEKAAKSSAIDALQYTQAAVNASNAIIGLLKTGE